MMIENSYYKMNDAEKQLLDTVSKITGTDYEVENDFVPVKNLFYAIVDMKYEYERKQEELEDVIQDRNDNYKPISMREQIEYNENW